jgi:hypothetical protein
LMSLCLCLPALLPPALQVLDLMGYEPSPENKINIHVGGWVLLGYALPRGLARISISVGCLHCTCLLTLPACLPSLQFCRVYNTLGSKEDTMRRWAANFNRLSPACRARMTGKGARGSASSPAASAHAC